MKKRILLLGLAIVSSTCMALGLTACAHEHVYTDSTVAPTCTERGYVLHTCNECGESYQDTFVEALGHSYGEWVNNGDDTHSRVCSTDTSHVETVACAGGTATCTEQAICETCSTAYGEPLGHDWSAWTYNNNHAHTRVCGNDSNHVETEFCAGGTATCTTFAVCDTCNSPYGYKKPHVYNQEVVKDEYKYSDATCFNPALYRKSCECGATSSSASLFYHGDKLGHDYGEFYSIGNNYHQQVCSRDPSHTYTDRCSGGTATCTEKAICETCHTAYGEPLSHDWSAWQSNGNNTHTRVCGNDSSHVETKNCHGGDAPCETLSICEDCNTAYGTVTGHTWGAWQSNGNDTHTRVCGNDSSHVETVACAGGTATCTEKAICETCNTAYGEPLSHNWGAWTSTGNNTHQRVCGNDNRHVETEDCDGGIYPCLEKSICDTCFTAYGEILGHNFGAVTYSYDGDQCTAKRVCQENSEHFEEETVTAEYRKLTDATCIAKEYGEYTATFTNPAFSAYSYNVYVGEKLAHSYGEYKKYSASTCVNYGKLRAYCTTQGCYSYLEKDDETDPPSGTHNYNAYDRCTNCGEDRVVSPDLVFTRTNKQDYQTLTSFGSCTDTEVVIPAYTGGYPVTHIDLEVFMYNDKPTDMQQALSAVTKVTIPRSVISIGEKAFANMQSLETVILECYNVDIAKNAFYNCPKLKTVIFTGEGAKIGALAFQYCDSLETVIIEKYVAEIGQSAFSGCSKLKNIELKSGLTVLNHYAFQGTAIESVTIPSTVTTMGSAVFSSCKNLKTAIFEVNSISLGASTFSGCTALKNVVLPKKATSIPSSFFANCSSLATVTIPSTVTSIADYAFDTCSSLVSITIPASVTSMGGSHVFRYCYKLVEIVNKSSLTINPGKESYSISNTYGNYAKYVHNGESVVKNQDGFIYFNYMGEYHLLGYVGEDTQIALPANINGEKYNVYDYAFSYQSGLTQILLTDGVLSVGKDAFKNCNSDIFTVKGNVYYLGTASNDYYLAVSVSDKTADTYTVETGAKVIANQAFLDCTKATTIKVPSTIISVGSETFKNCSALTFNVSNSVNYLGNDVDKYVIAYSVVDDTLTSYDIEDTTTIIYYAAFHGCDSATTIDIPNSVVQIGALAFQGCKALASAVIPSGVTKIPESAFYLCSKIETVTLPEGIISIGSNAFKECRWLVNINWPSELRHIGEYAFGSTQIKNVVIPNGVTSLEDNVFSNCGYIKTIVLPKTITSIGKFCFYYCSAITHIYYEGTAEDWNKMTINDTSGYITKEKVRYYYVENESDVPTDGGRYWHYVDGVPTVW